MRALLAIVPILAVTAACSAGAQENGEAQETSARGELGQRSFEVGEFHGVSLEGAHDVVVTVGGAPSVRAEGDAAALERLEIRVENGTLKVGNRRGSWSLRRNRGVTVYVTAPALDRAAIGGSGDMRIDRVQSERFAASIGGSGNIEIAALRARQANFSIAGSGNIRAAGSADAADVSVAGSGDLRLDALETRRADVSVVGSGDVAIRATEEVDATVMGSGDIVVHGPARCSVTKMGSGDVRCAA